jgi:hypothetical protein
VRSVRKILPPGAQELGRRIAVCGGRLSAGLRVEPSFIVVGAQRCGTTSLFRALMSHRNVLRPIMHKGVNYFDVSSDKSWSWYLGHFPLKASVKRHAAPGSDSAAVFEASGYYMFHPHAPRRIAAALPAVKIVAMVRDPVQRAYSAYKHEFARGFETESLERALELEDERIEPELAKMQADPTYESQAYRHQAYRRRGHYAEQLQTFADLLGPERLHIVESERFFSEPEQEYGRLLEFLRLPALMPSSFGQFNARPGSSLSPELDAQLREHFAPHDDALAAMLGRSPSWRS